jgi:hypothetical protein
MAETTTVASKKAVATKKEQKQRLQSQKLQLKQQLKQ